jgi:O-antigen ligase
MNRTPDPRNTPQRIRFGDLYVLCVPLAAGIAAIAGLKISGLSLTGYMWVLQLGVGVAMLAVEKMVYPRSRTPFPLAPWLVWLLWIAISFSWLDQVGFKHVQFAMQLSMPVLVGVLAARYVGSRDQLQQLIKAYYLTAAMLIFFVALWLVGLISDNDEAAINLATRPVAMTAVLIGGLAIAGAKRSAYAAWAGWSLCLLIPVLTASRMATMTMLILPVISPLGGRVSRKLLVVASIGLIALVVFSVPTMQQRFFRGESGSLQRILKGDFDSAGRFEAWPLVLEEVQKRPWLGHGQGSVEAFITEVWEGQTHPHNDYLRVAYELGILGLMLFLVVMAWQLWNLGRWIRSTDGVVQQAFAAAWIGLVGFLVIAFTDNPIIYNLYYMNPLFALMGAAYRTAWEETQPIAPRRTRPVPAKLKSRSARQAFS